MMTSILAVMITAYFSFSLLARFASFDSDAGYEGVIPYIFDSVGFVSFALLSIISMYVFNRTRKSMNI